MKTYFLYYTMLILAVFYTSCEQHQKNVPQNKPRSNNAGYSEAQLLEADTSNIPISMVRNVKLAGNGDILIASYLGVFRYQTSLPARMGSAGKDSVEEQDSFTNISRAISSSRFSSFWDVLEDRKGNLWFGTKDSGVYLLPTGQTTFQHFTTKNGLASNMATHIYEDKIGNIWIGASRYDARLPARTGSDGNEAVRQGYSFRKFSTTDGFPSNHIRLLLEDKSGKLWFGAQGESLFVYDARRYGEVGMRKPFTILKNSEGKPFNNVWGILEDRKGYIWFGATIIQEKRGDTSIISQGLWRYNGTTFTQVSSRGAYAIIQDKQGNIWTTGADDPPGVGQRWSVSRYDAKTLYTEKPMVTKIKLQQGMLLGIVEDTKGNIWFGAGSGVFRYNASRPEGYGNSITDFKRAASLP